MVPVVRIKMEIVYTRNFFMVNFSGLKILDIDTRVQYRLCSSTIFLIYEITLLHKCINLKTLRRN